MEENISEIGESMLETQYNADADDTAFNPYTEKPKDKKDWLVSIEITQIILTIVFSAAVFLLCKYGEGTAEGIGEAEAYFSSYSVNEETVSNVVQTVSDFFDANDAEP